MDTRIRELVAEADRGNRSSAEALFVALYEELHRRAKRELARCGPGVTLGATTLLHEAYLDISGLEGTSFPDRARFMAYAARVMRGLIIDFVRNRQAQKRGGNFELVPMSADVALAVPDNRELQRLADALDELAEVDPALAEIVDLKFFCGFSLTRSPPCAASRNGPFSVSGKKRAFICIERSAITRHSAEPFVARLSVVLPHLRTSESRSS